MTTITVGNKHLANSPVGSGLIEKLVLADFATDFRAERALISSGPSLSATVLAFDFCSQFLRGPI